MARRLKKLIKERPKRKNKFKYKVKCKFEFEKFIYWIVLIMIPLVIGALTNITGSSNDRVTNGFFLITFAFYIVGVMLIGSILKISMEYKLILDEYNNTLSTYNLTDSEKYEELQDIVEYYKFKTAGPLFRNFHKSLKIRSITEDEEERMIYYLTTDVECFFNEENIIYKNVYVKLINQIVQSLTGIGIFGTFLGIIQGVNGLNLNSDDYIKQSILELLSGIKVSFNSSLYGIMFSLVLAFALKIMMEMLMRQINKLIQNINEIMPVYTEQSVLEELDEHIQKQNKLMQKIIDKLELDEDEKEYHISI